MSKNCMFQYATSNEILADTDLISLKEAMELFDNNKSDYIERLEKDENPQMCVWINCDTNASYSETLHNWYAEDFKVIDGELWQRV